ncbi:short chain dehydrogenase family protein [Mycobacterium xenopi 3993]|nr:short chain dehydrogenase family protein [Mycobacterium xenopi 3993]
MVSDIDETAAKDTAAQIAAQGGVAHPYSLDVADAEAVEAFAEQLCAEHGVPDIVVNNAGIGQAGRFLDTPPEQFDRVLDVNFGGVVNGCRAFARGWSRAAPADTSSMSPRWPRGRPYSR